MCCLGFEPKALGVGSHLRIHWNINYFLFYNAAHTIYYIDTFEFNHFKIMYSLPGLVISFYVCSFNFLLLAIVSSPS